MEIRYNSLKIDKDTLPLYAYTNEEYIEGKIKAIVLEFHGLGSTEMRKKPDTLELECAKNNILTIYPYYGTWSWMNKTAVSFVDKVIEVACEKHSLDINATPIISTGGSMGGHSSLIYTRYAKITPKACFADCPVCDFKFHATEREDLPRTIYLAFVDDEDGIDMAIEKHSAYHLVDSMPKIPYYIVHGTADKAVNKEAHSDRFVARMRDAGRDVTYIEVEGMEHCYMEPFPEIKKGYINAIINACK